jgi:CrcB protein
MIILIIGGGAGTIARYALSGVVYQVVGTRFPYGTMAINLLGCFLVGFLVVISEERFFLSPNMRLFLMVGFCGAFTTFSTFILETANLIRDGESLLALSNIVISVVAGFLVFRLGILLAELI